jgi:putative transposase
VSEKYELVRAEKANFDVAMMCRILGVSRSGYYEWERRSVSASALRRLELAGVVKDKFIASGRTYGYRRVHAELLREGVVVDDDTVRALMREQRLMPVQVRRRPSLTRADASAGPLPDLVGRDFTGVAPGAKMVGDITEITTGEGPLFLATVLDCFSKSVLGWAVDDRYPASLVCAAIDSAADRIRFPDGAIFHSDQGSQYTSGDFAAKLAEFGIRQSVGRTGVCFDNAMAESFFGKLKTRTRSSPQFRYPRRCQARDNQVH